MYPSSPKGTDLRLDGRYALHTAVEDNNGTGGEFHIRGNARLVVDDGVYAAEIEKAGFPAKDGYVLFELLLDEASAITYDDGAPRRQKWKRATDTA